jgi:TolA-binding protein
MSDRQAAYLLALARIGQKKYKPALASLEQIGDLPADDALADSVEDARCSALLGLERYAEAARLLQSRLEMLPANSERANSLRVQLAVALARSGNLTDAISQIELLPATATSDPDVAAAVLVAAEKAYDGKQLLVAQRLFSLISAEHVPPAERGQALSGLAWTQFRLAGKQASAATFERLLRDYPDSPLAAEAALLRARSLEDTQQADAALATYRLVIDKYSDSPLVPQALWGAARLHEKLDQDREAAALLTKLVGEFPKFAERDAALYQLGWVQSDLQDLPAAEAAHAALIKEYPGSQYWADAAYRLAELAARRKETTKAIELADQVLAAPATEGVRENALYLRGQLAAAEAKWDDVARYMGEHAKQFPASRMNLSARYWQAEAAFRKGDYDAASKQLTQLEIAGQSRREAWLGIVPLRRAQCLAQQKHWTEALRLAESVAKRYPQFAQLYEADYLIGRALGSLARFDEARAAYDRVLQSPEAKGTETAAMAQWMIGETYFHQKRYAEATAAYELCLEQHAYPRWQSAALLQAGKCRLLTGDHEAARQDLQRVASEFADQPLAAEARSRLESLRTGPPAAASLAEKSR